MGTGVWDRNDRPDTSFDGHSRAATVNLSLLHFHNSEPETQFCQSEGAGAGNRGGPERAIQADSPRSVKFESNRASSGEPTVCAGALAQAGESGEEQEQTRQHPGRTAASSAGAGLCAAGCGCEN